MSTGTSFNMHLITAPWDEMVADIRAVQDRATMYALRQTARAFIKGARAAAPVYSGSDPRPVPGDLRRSIKSGRTIKQGGGTFELHVSPTGEKKKGTSVHYAYMPGRGHSDALRGVPLYAGKMEQRYGYMRAGYATAMPHAREIYESAYKKAFAKYLAR